jgi:hypothetical protein
VPLKSRAPVDNDAPARVRETVHIYGYTYWSTSISSSPDSLEARSQEQMVRIDDHCKITEICPGTAKQTPLDY